MPEEIKKTEELSAEKIIADTLKTSQESIDLAKQNTETLKSVAESLSKMVEVKTAETPESKSEILELKSELALVKARQEATNAAFSGGKNDKVEKTFKNFVSSFKNALVSKSSIKLNEESNIYNSCGVMEEKSLLTFGNTSAGAFVPPRRILGEININLQTVSPVTSLVNNINGGAIVAQELGYSTFDPSLVEVYESGENAGKTETPNNKYGDVAIHVMQNSAKIKISDKTLHAAEGGELTTNPILRELMAIERFYEKKIARQILNGAIGMGVNGILPVAKQSGFAGAVIATANDNVVKLRDILMLGQQLKAEYLRRSAILIDRKALYELYLEEADDGHLKIEQFDYASGIAALRTPEMVIPLIGVDSSYLDANVAQNDGFANYTSFVSSSTILSGYTPSGVSGGTDNAGKAVAVMADFNSAYALVRSSIVQVGYDNSFGNLINQGYVWGGKIGYVGGKLVNQEAIAVLYVQ